MTTVAQQKRMQQNADRSIRERIVAFHDLVTHPTNPMTRADLVGLIARRPDRYEMFSGWLEVLK